MRLPDKEDLKCYVFIIISIFLLTLATFYFQYVIRFTLLVFFYWYISIPLIIISSSSIDFLSRRVRIKNAYESINSVEVQESFRKLSGEYPLKNGQLTKAYKKWLIQKVEIPKYKIKRRSRASPKDIKGLIVLIILLIVIIFVLLIIYAEIFPDYRLPIAW